MLEPDIGKDEQEELMDVIRTRWVTEGPKTKLMEQKFSEMVGVTHAIAYANGTLALYALLKAHGIKEGDEVIVPDLTFIATANAVILAGATPVFVDVHPYTYCIMPEAIERAITARTKAIMPVHLYIQMADMPRIMDIAKKHALIVIEDAAQAIGMKIAGKHAGSFGHSGMISFYGNKTITTGEGGIVLTNDDEIARSCYRLKNHGRDRKGIFVHEHIGYNFSFTDLQAAVALGQLKKLPQELERKNQIRAYYERKLHGIVKFASVDPQCTPVHWLTNVLVDDPGALAQHLETLGIQTRRFFLPLHQQPCYKHLKIKNKFPNADAAYDHCLSLPSGTRLSQKELDEVCTAIQKFYARTATKR